MSLWLGDLGHLQARGQTVTLRSNTDLLSRLGQQGMMEQSSIFSPQELESCKVLCPLHCIWQGVVWCCSKKGTCCNPNRRQHGKKSSRQGLLRSSHLSTEDKRCAPQEHQKYCKGNYFRDRVLLVTSHLTLNKEIGCIGTKLNLICHALYKLKIRPSYIYCLSLRVF